MLRTKQRSEDGKANVSAAGERMYDRRLSSLSLSQRTL